MSKQEPIAMIDIVAHDVAALRQLARTNNFTLTETKESRTADHYVKTVRID